MRPAYWRDGWPEVEYDAAIRDATHMSTVPWDQRNQTEGGKGGGDNRFQSLHVRQA